MTLLSEDFQGIDNDIGILASVRAVTGQNCNDLSLKD
jgi:hypothetical protein